MAVSLAARDIVQIMQLFFVRHGQTAANLDSKVCVWRHNYPLTKEGRKQATRASKVVQSNIKQPALIFSSPLLRTTQTAEILAEHLELKINVDDRLQEAIVGAWQDRSVADINNYLRSLPYEERANFRPPQGETWIEIGNRVAMLVAELSNMQIRTVILVSHDAPIRFGIGTLLKSDPSTWSDAKFPTGSVSLLEGDGFTAELLPIE